MYRFLFAIILLSTCALSAQIIETMTIRDVDKHRDVDTLVIYDLDNTLIEPTQLLGSDQWFYYRLQQLIKELGDKELALEKALCEWIAAQTFTRVKIVEEGSAKVISDQQEEGVVMMGLTTRDCAMSMVTGLQLNKLNIDFTKTPPFDSELFFRQKKNILFQDGVLYTSGCNKGKCFRQFLELSGNQPKRVLFINDKYANIKEVADACYEDGIEFIGLRYGFLDDKIARFDPNIAEIQSASFANVLTDEEAHNILMARQKEF